MTPIAVIGAGITGVTTAYALAQRGYRVTVLDRQRYAAGLALLAALVLGLLVWNISAGSVSIPPGEVLAALFAPEEGGIVWGIRLPRVLAAAILGGALSVSGFLLQTFFANPIAGPFVLGISSGAKLTVALVLVTFLSRGVVISSMARSRLPEA